MSTITIKSEREYLHEICAKIDSGYYAIPVFQRNYVWKKEQVLDLFDSISKGYPIGSIMLWNTEDLYNSKDILTDQIKDTPKPQYYVLDGRQRLTTFYGCITNKNKPDIFKLNYNLDSETFEYISKESINSLPVSSIYDTFILLEKLQEIKDKVPNEKEARRYIENARRLNTILQGYVIGEMLLNNCSLDEASIVFTRINSKGTDISKVSMLQAISYKNDKTILLSEEIESILSTLQVYDFDKLSSDDILNCFYRWYGKNFYDSKMKDLENVDFTTYLPEIKDAIIKSVDFLYHECHVLSSKLLPYTKQLIALTWYFKEEKTAKKADIEELKKWFFYTTYTQAFQNSSLSNVRFIFKRFEAFIFGTKETAFDYEPIVLNYLFDFKFKINSAKTDFMLLAFINHYLRFSSTSDLYYNGYFKIIENAPECYFIYLNDEDRSLLNNCFQKGANNLSIESFEIYQKYILNSNMLYAYWNNDYNLFKELRKLAILECERDLLQQVGIQVHN